MPEAWGCRPDRVTAIFPHAGAPWEEPVYVGTHILNGYGELIGINQLREWGILMSPVVLTSSLAIGKAYETANRRWPPWRSPGASSARPGEPWLQSAAETCLRGRKEPPAKRLTG